MATCLVRFKGLLTEPERERLEAANIAIRSSEPSLQVGPIKTGRPIYTVALEASSPEEALAKVRGAIEPDTANFDDWEAETA
jgi:hypothetical protein